MPQQTHEVVGIPAGPTAPTGTRPDRLHLGSGKTFKPDYLNVDIDPLWRPDLVMDLAGPLPTGDETVATQRFGDVSLTPGSFQEILAVDVLEHVPDLPRLMRNCRDLLAVGGVMRISVPYELSLGAWSDPTHVRAFNERSWDYFTQWTWYFGWRDSRFDLTRLDFIGSELGQKLSAEGMPMEELLRTPRAVDSMQVELTKVPFQQKDWEVLAHYHQRPLPQ